VRNRQFQVPLQVSQYPEQWRIATRIRVGPRSGVPLCGQIKADVRRAVAIRVGDLLKDSGLPHATAASDQDDWPHTVMDQSAIWLLEGKANQLCNGHEQLIPIVEHCHPLSVATKIT
jgi:hypothetical protein